MDTEEFGALAFEFRGELLPETGKGLIPRLCLIGKFEAMGFVEPAHFRGEPFLEFLLHLLARCGSRSLHLLHPGRKIFVEPRLHLFFAPPARLGLGVQLKPVLGLQAYALVRHPAGGLSLEPLPEIFFKLLTVLLCTLLLLPADLVETAAFFFDSSANLRFDTLLEELLQLTSVLTRSRF
jgi:hypothetical protein